jgi:bifunctional non-homologous end joining protein LigD
MKFDGYRILARLQDGKSRLLSRNGKDWTNHFPTVATAVEALPVKSALLDGEVAIVMPNGTTSFQALQNALSGQDQGQLAYFLFDLLHLEGSSLTGAMLEARKTLLKDLIGPPAAGSPLRYSDHVTGSGEEFLRAGLRARHRGHRLEAPRCSLRADALAIVAQDEVPAAAGIRDRRLHRARGRARGSGRAAPRRARSRGRTRVRGQGGDRLQREGARRPLQETLRARAAGVPVQQAKIPGITRAHWVEPELVAEVAFGEWTADGRLRHPSFQGLRADKNPKDVVREKPRAVRRRGGMRMGADAPAPKAPSAAKRPAREPIAGRREAQPEARTEGGRRGTGGGVRLTHPDRVLYPPQGDHQARSPRSSTIHREWILPHVKGRPLTLVRCPEGTEKGCFYMKHSGVWAPEALRRVKIQEKTKVGEYLVVDDVAGLISLVQMGILEIHTWNALADTIERPTAWSSTSIPIPPWAGTAWPRGALALRQRLRELGLDSFVKTTGGKGLHVVVPLRPASTWEESFAFSRAISEEKEKAEPGPTRRPCRRHTRRGRILLDYMRNNRGNTSVAGYSTRARPGAPVSTPITWRSSRAGSPDQFHVGNIGSGWAR